MPTQKCVGITLDDKLVYTIPLLIIGEFCGLEAHVGESWHTGISRDDGAVGASNSFVGQRQLIEGWARKRGGAQIVAHCAEGGCSCLTFDWHAFYGGILGE